MKKDYPKSIKIEPCDLDRHMFRRLINKEFDTYKICSLEDATRIYSIIKPKEKRIEKIRFKLKKRKRTLIESIFKLTKIKKENTKNEKTIQL